MSNYSFKERLDFGQVGEKMFINNSIFICKPILTEWVYSKCEEHKQKQRNGIDFSVNFNPINIEIKTRDYKYYKHKDILLEVYSVVEKRVPGWVYTTKSDAIVYTWLDESKTKFVGGYIIIVENLKRCFNDLLKKHWPNTCGNSTTDGRYTTAWFTVPISDFPENVLIEFDPNELNKMYSLSK